MFRCLLLLSTTLTACVSPTPVVTPRVADEAGAPARLELSATASVRNDTLTVAATVTNRSRRRVEFMFGACSVNVRGWRGELGAGRPDIDSRLAGSPEFSSRACVAIGYAGGLEPGESTEVGDLEVPIAYLLDDDDPDGAYDLVAVFDYNEESLRSARRRGSDREVSTRLGIFDLDAHRPPMGSEIVRGGTRFRLDSLRADHGRVRGVIVAEPRPGRSLFIALDTCAATLLAFADGSDRDAAPRAGVPVATREVACGQPLPHPVAPQQPDGRGPFYATRDRPARAPFDVAVGDLLAGQPAGTYALALAVRPLGGFGSPDRLPRVYLAAGEAEWSGR